MGNVGFEKIEFGSRLLGLSFNQDYPSQTNASKIRLLSNPSRL